jgi:hypothetical protein
MTFTLDTSTSLKSFRYLKIFDELRNIVVADVLIENIGGTSHAGMNSPLLSGFVFIAILYL